MSHGLGAPAALALAALDIRIAGASVTPVNARTETRAGMPITLVVDSDAEDELHVHATPEHTFAVHPGEDQRFTFTVDVPGRVDVELHRANLTVTTIYVRPRGCSPTASAGPPTCRSRSPTRWSAPPGRSRSPSRSWRSPGGNRVWTRAPPVSASPEPFGCAATPPSCAPCWACSVCW